MKRARRLAVLLPMVSGLALAGCTASVGGPGSIKGDDLAKEVSTQLTHAVGRKPDKVTCPDLKAERGAKVTCRLTDAGRSYDTFVTVTSVKHGNAKFDIKVAGQPS